MRIKQTLLLSATVVIILLQIFSIHKLSSERVSSPPGYANDPPAFQSCTYCHPHSGPFADSTAYVLTIGYDTTHMVDFNSGITTYQPSQVYYLRIIATHIRPVYGFELTADDSSGIGTDIGSFEILDTTNTSLTTIEGYATYVGHHNASQNKQWTFRWTAPPTDVGPITFYWAGNDANGIDSIPPNGDTIYIVKKTITPAPGTGISPLLEEFSDVHIFPAVCSNSFQIDFNVTREGRTTAQLVNMQGQVVMQVFNELLELGNYNRRVDVSFLASGIYLLKMQTANACFVRRVIRQ